MDKKVLAVIPARSGSKSVPHKNIRMTAGRPMLAWSVAHAQASELVDRIVLSTDSEEYAQIGREYGAETPFLRPACYATDTATDLEVFTHCLEWLKEQEGYETDIVVQLRPTYPIRDPRDIDRMVELLLEHPEVDSVRSIAPAKEIAYKMWRREADGSLSPLLTDIPEAYNMPRQELPQIFYQNACIDVTRGSVIMEKHSMTGKRILGYEMGHNYDIDTEAEWMAACACLELQQGGRRFVVDIDGVVAKKQPELDYAKAEPDEEMVKLINRLYEAGNYIVMFTARGYVTGKDWEAVTKGQFERWGLKYHELIFGKPNADYYIDDKFLDMGLLRQYMVL